MSAKTETGKTKTAKNPPKKTSRKFPTWLIIVLIVVGALAFLGFSSGRKQTSTLTPQSPGADSGLGSGGLSFMDALLSGDSYKCEFQSEEGAVTTYVKGDMVRVDGFGFVDPSGQGATGGSMISDGKFSYIWNDDTGEGMKFKIPDEEEIADGRADDNPDVPSLNQDSFNPKEWAEQTEQNYEVDCSPSNVSNSMFTPPSNIKFQDFSAMMEGLQEVEEKVGQGQGFDQEQLEKLQKLLPKE